MSNIRIVKSTLDASIDVVRKHMAALAFPPDSWLENKLLTGEVHRFERAGECVGYFVIDIEEKELCFFHVLQAAYQEAPALLERVAADYDIETMMVMSQDAQAAALLVEWDTETARQACWFTDGGAQIEKPESLKRAAFRLAAKSDAAPLREASGDFFDDPSCGFENLEQRIGAETIFVLEEGDELIGGGIIEPGRICPQYTSIGMFVCPQHRKRGAAKTILLNLKEYAYKLGTKPLAGCWYYNTLSRMSLESAGMIVTALGVQAKLIKKDKPPKRTGNPPGQLVED